VDEARSGDKVANIALWAETKANYKDDDTLLLVGTRFMHNLLCFHVFLLVCDQIIMLLGWVEKVLQRGGALLR